MIEIFKEIFYPIILLCPIFAVPITYSKNINVPGRVLLFAWVVMILSMIFGVPGKASSLLLLELIDPTFLPDQQQLFGLGLISSWGASYPLFILFKKRMKTFQTRELIPNITSSFVIFYGTHLLFAAFGIFLLKVSAN